MFSKRKTAPRVVSGALIGAVNGLFGGGGGMVAVPVLKRLSGYGEKRAHATAIMVMAPVCAASAITYMLGGYLRADILIPATLGSVAGGFAGARLLNSLPDFAVKAIFVAIMFAAGLRMLF